MRQFIQRLKAAWIFSRVHPYVEYPKGYEWTDEDAKALSSFLSRPTGAKWRLEMLLHVQNSAQRAIIERNYATYECGYASGCRGLMAVNDSLLVTQSPTGSESQSEKDGGAEQADLLAQFAP